MLTRDDIGQLPSAVVQPIGRMDDETLEGLIAEYSKPLFRYVYKLTMGDRQLSEEIVQETFLRAWQRPHIMADPASSPRPWLYTVARNLVWDNRRARGARPQEVTDIELNLLPDNEDTYERLVASDEIRQALAKLSANHRDVLVEVYFRDQSLVGTATSLGIPVGTVKSRLHYAQQALKLALGRPELAGTQLSRRDAATSIAA